MAVDIQRFFSEDLPEQFERYPDAAKQLGFKCQLNVTGEGGGEWFIDVTDSGPTVQPGNPGGANVTITLSAPDFQAYYANPQAVGMQLYFAGKLKISGDTTLSMKLHRLFRLGR